MTADSATRTAEHADTDVVAFIIATDHRPATFRIDDDAFDRWFAATDAAAAEPDAPDWLPDWIDEGAGAVLSQLFLDAKRNGVIAGAGDIDLNVYGDDDGETSGFYVILNNRAGAQTALGLTSGWQELLHLDDLPPRRRARAYLDEICAIANFTLANLQVVGGH